MGKSITDSGLSTRTERRGYLEEQLRCKTREWIERMVNEELEVALGVGRYERSESRRGYRKGVRERSFTTRTGKHEIAMPRGAYFEPAADGKREWTSELIGRYARRSDEVEEALLKSYLCGTNTRRIAHALGPLLEGAALSKSTVSRIVSCLGEQFEQWRNRIRRNGMIGEDLLKALTDIYLQHNMQAWADRRGSLFRERPIPRIICSEALE